MRRLHNASFSKSWKKQLGWKKGSRVIVILEKREDWEQLPEEFQEEFFWFFQVEFCECLPEETECASVIENEKDSAFCQRMSESMGRRRPEGIVGIGSFSVLQRVCLWREQWYSQGDEGTKQQPIPLFLISGKDRWQAFFRETLWIRGKNGRTQYWGYVGQHPLDALIVRHGKTFAPVTVDAFEEEIYRWKDYFQRRLWREKGAPVRIDNSRFLPTDKRGKWELSVQRDICEELAEPLSILYGVPVEIGSYFALCYLYERLSEEQQQEMCHSLEIEQPAYWYLESLAAQFRRNEITGIWLCEKDIWLFTQMAMEGMENYPRESLLSWRQVEDFYRRFLM